MFGLIRLVIFTGAAFVAGMLYQSLQHRAACTDAGGTMVEGFCHGAAR